MVLKCQKAVECNLILNIKFSMLNESNKHMQSLICDIEEIIKLLTSMIKSGGS